MRSDRWYGGSRGRATPCRSASTPEVGGVLLADETTKSEAGKRLVGIPAAIVPELRRHLDRWSEPGAHGRVFIGPRGGRPLRSNYNRYWHDAVSEAGLAGLGLHFHDLRHTANGFASREANVKELMARMGHASARAALIYQHVDPEREREIAQALSKKIEAERPVGDLAREWHEAEDGDGK
jgi:integrase